MHVMYLITYVLTILCFNEIKIGHSKGSLTGKMISRFTPFTNGELRLYFFFKHNLVPFLRYKYTMILWFSFKSSSSP